MKTRIMTGAILAILLIPLLFVPPRVFYIAMLMIMGIAFLEVVFVVKKKEAVHRFWMILFPIFGLLVYSLFLLVYFGILSILYIYVAFFLMMMFLWLGYIFDEKSKVSTLGSLFLMTLYISLGFFAISVIRSYGLGMLVYLLMLAMLTDIFAYFSGYLFGKRKLAPLISPKKTVEGAIGGTLISVLIASLFAGFMSIFPYRLVVLIPLLVVSGVVVSFLAQCGDLLASKFKRSYEVKDFSSLLPGHGGIMDRFDSSLFAAIALAFVLFVLEVF